MAETIKQQRKRFRVENEGIFTVFPNFPGSTLPRNPEPADFLAKRNGAITESTFTQGIKKKRSDQLTRTQRELEKMGQ